MFLEFYQLLAFLFIIHVYGLDVPFEPYTSLRQSKPEIVEYPQRIVSSSNENKKSEPFVRVYRLSEEDSREGPISYNEELKDSSSNTKENEKSIETRVPIEYIDDYFHDLRDDSDDYDSRGRKVFNENTGKRTNFYGDKLVESGENIDFAENPNLRVFEEEVRAIPRIRMTDEDGEILKKINSNETIAYDNSTDFLENQKVLDEQTKTICETTTLSMIQETTKMVSSSSKKKSTKRRKGKKRSGKKRNGINASKKSKKKLKGKKEKKVKSEKSKEMIFVGNARKYNVPGYPVAYGENLSPTTNEMIEKYQGIDRRPTTKPLLRNLKTKPEMELLHYETIIRSRYARTTVEGRVQNYGEFRSLNVNVILPQKALITKLATTISGRTIEAVIRDKNDTIDLPKSTINGTDVGTMIVETRDCDLVKFTVDVPGDSTLNYTITYEYLLERNLGFYSVPIIVHNNMWIKDLMVRWRIQEERNLTNLITPLIYGTTALPLQGSDDPLVRIINEEPGMAELIWKPTIMEQKNISSRLGRLSKNGVVGILEIKYDVSHEQDPCGQVVIQDDEYFAQFFAAPNQPPLTKYVVFVLDLSDSMRGEPIKQLKTAMYYILDTLQPMDNFTLINFSDEVNIMNINDRGRDIVYRGIDKGSNGRGKKTGKTAWPGNLYTYEATANNIEAAKQAVKIMELRAYTNIYDALVMGFKAVKDMASLPPAQIGQPHPEPFIVFLTDGQASDGPSWDDDVIMKMIEDQNRNTKATMFPLGFGGDADMRLLRRFALATNGIEKRIYKGIDAVEQLVTFFQSIKSPLLKDAYFKYNPKQVIPATLTVQSFPLIHRGKEVIITGKFDPKYPDKSSLYVDVMAIGRYSSIKCEKTMEKLEKSPNDSFGVKYSNATTMTSSSRDQPIPDGIVKRIWAFGTLNQLRDELELGHFGTRQEKRCDNVREPRDRMHDISLGLNYAMPRVTDLVYNDTPIDRVSISPDTSDQHEETKSYDPLEKYSWILKLRDTYGFAKLPIANREEGRMYVYLSLGVSKNPPPPRSCVDEIDGTPGECRYLPECPDPRVLETPEKFQRHFCRLGSYAGVCCTDSMLQTDRTKR